MIHQAMGQGYELPQNSKIAYQRVFRQKYISWNASSAAHAEVIEYLEELIDLTKLLVGASEFRSGLLMRPSYVEYVNMTEKSSNEVEATMDTEAMEILKRAPSKSARGEVPRRRRDASGSAEDAGEKVPASLRRIHSRKIEAGIQRQKTHEN